MSERLALAGLDWLVGAARPHGPGLTWPAEPGDTRFNPSLYSGTAGVVVTLLEAHAHTGDDRYADLALDGARVLADALPHDDSSSLYFGATGLAWVLDVVGRRLDQGWAAAAARDGLHLVRQRFDGERWGPQTELLGGNAGIGLGALATGDLDLAVLAVEPYLRTAEQTDGGVQWEVKAGAEPRLHHVSHGTLGIALALARVGAAAGRQDLVELALAGAADVVSRDEAGPDGFLVPHSDPQQQHPRLERYAFGWCHGPAGDAQAFRVLAEVTGDPAWDALVRRCWRTVTTSGLPARRRPGFWDNNGRCCGTAGVLALASDLRAGAAGDGGFADVLVADLEQRALVDAEGARWSNHEHRATPSDLPPHTGWAMGSAGIVRELLRDARIRDGGDPGYAVDWPDQLPLLRQDGDQD